MLFFSAIEERKEISQKRTRTGFQFKKTSDNMSNQYSIQCPSEFLSGHAGVHIIQRRLPTTTRCSTTSEDQSAINRTYLIFVVNIVQVKGRMQRKYAWTTTQKMLPCASRI